MSLAGLVVRARAGEPAARDELLVRYVATDAVPDVACFDVDQRGAAELVALRRLLATLAPKKRDAFVLMAIFELSAEEAGEVLGTFANTAASRYRHARSELEHELGDGSVCAPLRGAVGVDHG